MAGEDEGITVNVDDLDTIQVNVDDDATNQQAVVEVKPAKESKVVKTKRVDPDEPTGPTPEQALQEAIAHGKSQEEARRAAEATATSERAMREQAQRDAVQAHKTADEFRERADNSELTIIENSIASASAELETQQEAYTRAAEAGEFSNMAKIQVKIAKAAASLDRLEDAKLVLGTNPRKTTEGRVEAPQQVASSPAEQFLTQFAPAAQVWLRQHMDCLPASVGGDPVKNSKMMAGHYQALAQNIGTNTEAYFKVIEQHLGLQQEQTQATQHTSRAAETTQVVETAKPAKHVAAPSAAPSRDVPTGQNQQPRNVREVRLTKDQQEMAKVSFPHLPEAQAYGQYARNLIELESEGKLGRLTH
jgi:hypothetical protein